MAKRTFNSIEALQAGMKGTLQNTGSPAAPSSVSPFSTSKGPSLTLHKRSSTDPVSSTSPLDRAAVNKAIEELKQVQETTKCVLHSSIDTT